MKDCEICCGFVKKHYGKLFSSTAGVVRIGNTKHYLALSTPCGVTFCGLVVRFTGKPEEKWEMLEYSNPIVQEALRKLERLRRDGKDKFYDTAYKNLMKHLLKP